MKSRIEHRMDYEVSSAGAITVSGQPVYLRPIGGDISCDGGHWVSPLRRRCEPNRQLGHQLGGGKPISPAPRERVGKNG